MTTYLEALVLENALDGSIFSVWGELCLKNNTKGAIAHDLALRILHLLRFAGQAILYFLANDLCKPSASTACRWGASWICTSHAQAREACWTILRRHLGGAK